MRPAVDNEPLDALECGGNRCPPQGEAPEGGEGDADAPTASPKRKICWRLLLLNMVLMGIGSVGGPLVQRLYYVHGGQRKWLTSFLLSAGTPTILVPIFLSYRAKGGNYRLIEPWLVASALVIGPLYGIDNFLYSTGLAYIPVSTSSLIISSQLAFTAIFAFILVRQKFTFYSLNSVVLMTMGTAVLALHTSNDRPEGVSKGRYLYGFFATLGAAALWGLIVPLIERSYRKAKKAVDSDTVMQYQFVMGMGAIAVCLTGMGINNDFRALPREARSYQVGRTKYIVVLVVDAVLWQIAFIGNLGVIHYGSALFSGIYTSLLIPITEIIAVIVFKDKFTGEKGTSLALALWGFISYFLGEYKKTKKSKLSTTP